MRRNGRQHFERGFLNRKQQTNNKCLKKHYRSPNSPRPHPRHKIISDARVARKRSPRTRGGYANIGVAPYDYAQGRVPEAYSRRKS